MTDPLEVVEGELVVSGDEECIDVSREAVVEVNHSAVHVNEDQINVEETDVDESEENIDEDCLNDPYSSLAVSFYIEIVEFEQVSGGPVFLCTVYDGDANKVKNSGDAVPGEYFGHNLREFSNCFDENVVCEGHQKENYCVDQSTNNNYRHFLHNVVRCILELDLIPSNIKLGYLDQQYIDPNILSKEMHIHPHPEAHYCHKHGDLELHCPEVLKPQVWKSLCEHVDQLLLGIFTSFEVKLLVYRKVVMLEVQVSVLLLIFYFLLLFLDQLVCFMVDEGLKDIRFLFWKPLFVKVVKRLVVSFFKAWNQVLYTFWVFVFGEA